MHTCMHTCHGHTKDTGARAWMDVVYHGRRRLPSDDGSVRSLDLEGPQVRFGVLARAIHQRQTGQEQDILLIHHTMELTNFHTDCIDAVQENTKF